MNPRLRFGHALRAARLFRRLPQDALGPACSRTYLSMLERGLKSPTLEKVEQLAAALDLHPLTLHMLTWLRDREPRERKALMRIVAAELLQVLKPLGDDAPRQG